MKQMNALPGNCTVADATNPINDLDTATIQRERKSFATLAAHFAIHGFVLIKGDRKVDGQAPYFLARWGMGAQPLSSIEAVEAYLVGLAGMEDGQKLQTQ